MPLPKPQDGETREQFVARFLEDEAMREEFPDEDQRRAVAEALYDGLQNSRAGDDQPPPEPPADDSAPQDDAPEPRSRMAASQSLELRGQVRWQTLLASGEDDLPRLEILAYTGGAIHPQFWSAPVVVDLEGMEIPSQRLPIRYEHDGRQGVGHTEHVAVENHQLLARGVVSRRTEAAREVVESARAGFPWQASVGLKVEQVESVPEGQTVEANGRRFQGPIYVVRKSTLREISIVDVGGDRHAQVQLAASFASPGPAPQPPAGPPPAPRPDVHAIRNSRPRGVAMPKPGNLEPKVLEAALCLRAGVPARQLEQWYSEQVLDRAHCSPMRRAGLHALLHEVAARAGLHLRAGLVDNETIRTAFEADRKLLAAGYSTLSLSGILTSTANKVLLTAFSSVAAAAPKIARQSDVNDFKAVERYRLNLGGGFDKVGPDGELKHAEISDQKYTNQLETRGMILTLSRQDIINDDLGAFLDIPRLLGRKAALARERALFELLLANPNNFFSTANGNYRSGADSALSIDGLTKAEELFLNQTDAAGDPVLAVPRYLLVPTSLKVTAQQLMTETRVNETTSTNKPKPASNPHVGKWEPVASPYLNAQGLSGSSSTGWYLLADPEDLPALEIVYLRGQRTPVIEQGETDFNRLGMSFRAYYDFGVNLIDPRGAVFSAGV